MRIGLDARLIAYRRGMGTYAYQLIHGLIRTSADFELVAFLDSADSAEALPSDPRLTARVLSPSPFPIWEQFAFPRAALRERVDLIHSPFNTAPLHRRNVPLVVTVHDVMYLLPTSTVPPTRTLYHEAGRRYRAFVVPRAAAEADHLLTISSASASDIHRMLGVEYERMTVVHHGLDPEYLAGRTATDDDEAAELRTLGILEPYVFGLGAIDPRKNTTRLLEAFSLVSRDAVGNPQLVISGLTPAGLDAFRELSTRLGIGSRVVLLGFVSEAHLRLLYRRARVFCYPSLYEGFGLPLIEAMASGTAVVSSAIDAVREVADDAAILIDPLSTASIASGLESVLGQDELRRDIIRRGSTNAQRFSWTKAVEAVLNVYRRVAARRADA